MDELEVGLCNSGIQLVLSLTGNKGRGLGAKSRKGIDSMAGSLMVRLSTPIWLLNSTCSFPHFFRSPSTWPLPLSTYPSSSSRAGKASTPLFPFLLYTLPASSRLLVFLPGNKRPSVHPPSGKAPARGGRPSPGRRVWRRGPVGTRLPIPYMDKCVQAKSGIQAPDVSLQLSGHRTGDRGEGVGTVGRKEGERHQPAAAPALPKFHFLSVGSFPGPRELSRDK